MLIAEMLFAIGIALFLGFIVLLLLKFVVCLFYGTQTMIDHTSEDVAKEIAKHSNPKPQHDEEERK